MSFYTDVDNQITPTRKKKHFFRFFSEVPREGRILDVACSTGNFIQHAPEKVIGIDLDESALAVAREQGFDCQYGDITKGLPFEENFFDAVNCDSIIEHLDNPLSLITEVHRILKQGGTVVIVTPDIKRVGLNFWLDYTHKSPFTKKGLERIFYDAGFQTIRVERHSLNYLRPIARFFPGHSDGKQKFLWRLEDIIGSFVATNWRVVAKK